MEEYFLYDHRGLVVRTHNLRVVKAVAVQILNGFGMLFWYTHTNSGGTYFDYNSFAEAISA